MGLRLLTGPKLTMLAAYIDESVTAGDIFVMGGFIASAERWQAFSAEWAEVLTLGGPHYRKISEYKASEMSDGPLAIEQSGIFYSVIEKHVDFAVSVVVRLKDLEEAFRSVDWPNWLDNVRYMSSPYLHAFRAITTGITMFQKENHLEGPIDFTFDEISEESKCLAAWRYVSAGGPPEVKALLGRTPSFRKSHEVMPLQAADMYVYWAREALLNLGKDAPFKVTYPWPYKKGIKGLNIFQTKEMLANEFKITLTACNLARQGLSPDEIRAALYPESAAD